MIDGDTIELCNGERVRYLGIDAPESHMPYHAEALAYHQNLVLGKKVRLEYDVQKRDAFGRLMAYVWLEDRMMNREILLAGFAILYTLPPNVKYADVFFEDMKTAQSAFVGIWAELKDRVKISFVNYDAEGDDRSSLNGEWVDNPQWYQLGFGHDRLYSDRRLPARICFPCFYFRGREIGKGAYWLRGIKR